MPFGRHVNPTICDRCRDPPEVAIRPQWLIAFAKTGNPNGHGNYPWPRFTRLNQVLLSQNVPQMSHLTAQQLLTRRLRPLAAQLASEPVSTLSTPGPPGPRPA